MNRIPQILEAVNYDIENTVFSFIPNTAESAFYGMVEGVENWLVEEKQRKILEKGKDITSEELRKILMLL